MSKFLITALFFLAVSMPFEAFCAVRTVDYGGLGGYTTIQSAVDASFSGDDVHVAAGTYTENVTMKDGVSLYGGYSASDWGFRNITANVTVIDAAGSGSTVTASVNNATLDGFTIKGSASAGIVAGVYISAASPVVSNNVITQNGRHGVYVELNANPTIAQNIITSNSYYGVYGYSFGTGTPNIYNNTIHGNAYGIYLYSINPVLRNNIVSSNTSYGIFNYFLSVVDSDYNDVWSNAQGNYYFTFAGPHDISSDPLYLGGGDFHLSDSPTLSPCIDAGIDVGLAYTGLPDIGRWESSATRPDPWPPEGLVATPLTAKVFLEWAANSEPNISGYKLSYGTAPGVYTDTIDVGNVTEYTVTSLFNEASYFFAIKAYNSLSNESGYSDEISATPTAGDPELPHYNWDASYGGGDCTGCHVTESGSNLLPAGFDYRYDTALCLSCHNLTGMAKDLLIDAAASHPVFVNATTGGNNVPTYGNFTGRFSNRMADHLNPDGQLVCNTCHNVMEKTEDPGRVWELALYDSEVPWRTYILSKGGWSLYGYMEPEVYMALSLTPKPTYVKDRHEYRLYDPLQDFRPETGMIKFKSNFYQKAYVTLKFPYLRVDNSDNIMCLDCHNTGTHELLNCLVCHETHNYTNRLGVKPKVKTPNSGIKAVVFTGISGANSFADGDATYDGICEVCHTQTLYHRNDGSVLNNHTGTGLDYSGEDCTTCHTHGGGFYP